MILHFSLYNHKKEPSEKQMKQLSGHYDNYIDMQLYMICTGVFKNEVELSKLLKLLKYIPCRKLCRSRYAGF